jgi:hypothetical protein
MTKLSRPAAAAFPNTVRKAANSRRNVRGARLAPGVLAGARVLALVALLAQGCLVPQSVDPITTRPHTIPRVDLTKLPDYMFEPMLPLDPQGPADMAANPPCQCRLDVSIPAIIADDPTVDIEIRVFVDYDLNNVLSQSPAFTIRLPGSFETPVSDTTRALAPLSFNAARLNGTGIHVVELVMGEAAGFAPDTDKPPHRAMLSTFESSTFKFVVNVAHDPSRQSCSDSPPAPSPAQVKSCP